MEGKKEGRNLATTRSTVIRAVSGIDKMNLEKCFNTIRNECSKEYLCTVRMSVAG